MATPAYAALNGDSLEAEGLSLRDYLAVVWRRKWIIALVVVVATGAAYFFAARQPAQYAASTDLIYETNIDVANPLSNYGYTNPQERDLEMRAISNILQSPDMVGRAETILKSTYDGAFVSNAPAKRDAADASSSASDVPGYTVTSATPESTTGSSSAGSNIVTISGQSTDPALAAAAANAYATAFVAWRLEQQHKQIDKAMSVVQSQIDRFPTGTQQSADYLLLQQRLGDLQILYKTVTGNYRTLAPASEPDAPFEPRPLRSAVLGFGVGLFAGIGLAFLLEQFDTRLRRQDEVARILRQPVLGRIPRLSKKLLGKDALVALHRPESQAAESFRMIRTNLEFMSVDNQVRSLIVTSCVQGEGKSVSVANLAIVMAMAGKKVVVVDGDLRRPRMHEYFHVRNEVGVSTVSTAKTPLGQALQPVQIAPPNGDPGGGDFADWAAGADAKSKLFVLPSGPLPPNPGEIVSSRRFGLLIKALEKEADLVIVDSPAMLAVGDTAAIASKVDGLVFLVDPHVVKRPVLQQAAEQLAKLPVAQLGLIMRADGTSGGHYGYGYGYGKPYASATSGTGEPGANGPNGARQKALARTRA